MCVHIYVYGVAGPCLVIKCTYVKCKCSCRRTDRQPTHCTLREEESPPNLATPAVALLTLHWAKMADFEELSDEEKVFLDNITLRWLIHISRARLERSSAVLNRYRLAVIVHRDAKPQQCCIWQLRVAALFLRVVSQHKYLVWVGWLVILGLTNQ